MDKYVKIKDSCERLRIWTYHLYKYKEKYGLPNAIKVVRETDTLYYLDLPVYQGTEVAEHNNLYDIYKTECEEVDIYNKKELDRICDLDV